MRAPEINHVLHLQRSPNHQHILVRCMRWAARAKKPACILVIETIWDAIRNQKAGGEGRRPPQMAHCHVRNSRVMGG